MTDVVAPAPDAAAPATGLAPVEVAVAAPAAVIGEAAPVVAVEPAPATPASPAAVVETPAAVEVALAEPAAPVAAEPEAKPETAPEPAAPERPKTLLEKADEERAAKEADKTKKPDEAAKKPGEEAKPDDAAKPEAEAEAPLTFELPKELKAAPEQMQEFGDLVRAAKSDPKESGQKLLAMHAKAMEAYAKDVSDNQWKVWNQLIEAKDKEILADPILGGAGHETAKAKVVRMRDLLVPESRRAAFSTFMNVTGAGSWPEFWHIFYQAGDIFDEPPMPAPGGKPPNDSHIQQPTGRFALLHDHPTSQMKRD